MRIMALDPGSKRIGVALSDDLKMLASPAGFIDAEPESNAFAQLQSLIQSQQVESIVVGMPRNMNGTYGPAAESTRAFIQRLQSAVSIPIRTWDERLTSVQAGRALREAGFKGKDARQKVDASSAAILLQSFLDAQP